MEGSLKHLRGVRRYYSRPFERVPRPTFSLVVRKERGDDVPKPVYDGLIVRRNLQDYPSASGWLQNNRLQPPPVRTSLPSVRAGMLRRNGLAFTPLTLFLDPEPAMCVACGTTYAIFMLAAAVVVAAARPARPPLAP